MAIDVAKANIRSDNGGGIAIDPAASRIATSLPDGTVQPLDASTGGELMRLPGHAGVVSTLSFSPDGKKLISVGFGLIGDDIRVWALDIDDLISIARRNVTRRLTDDECQQYLHVDRCPA